MIGVVIAATGLISKALFGPAFAEPAVRVELKLEGITVAYTTHRDVLLHWHARHDGVLRKRYGYTRLDETLRVNVAIIAVEVNAKNLLILLQALGDDFNITRYEVVVGHFHVQETLV